jgi:hypothetical protein
MFARSSATSILARTVGALTIAFTLLAAPIADGATAQPNQTQTKPEVRAVRIVILVDESGSLSPEEVQREKDAVSLIALSELSSDSTLAVYGFGSSNGPGQNAVVPYCPSTLLNSPEARQSVVSCAQAIHRREPTEGNDTDHAAALREAVDELSRTDPDTPRIVFLLTDGVMDVSNSPQYGRDAQQRNQEATRLLNEEVLPDARSSKVQIWPLGFGAADQNALDVFAASAFGALDTCRDVKTATPRATVVSNTSDVSTSLLTALGSARCAVVEEPSTGTTEPGSTIELKVKIPVIATDGSIAVTKIDPSIKVTYVDPDGEQAPASGVLDEQEFQVAGVDAPVEALRIRNPKPGEWTVRLQSPLAAQPQLVQATVLWQGAVSSALEVQPVLARPGKKVTIRVRLQTRSGIVTDAAALEGLTFRARVTGDGFNEITVPLADDGVGADANREDGSYTGTFVLPKTATGNVEVRGSVQGEGVAGDERSYFFNVNLGSILDVQAVLDEPANVNPGDTLDGTLRLTNEGASRRAALAVIDLPSNARVTLTPQRVRIPAGKAQRTFEIRIGEDQPVGQLSGRVVVRAKDGTVLGQASFLTDVSEPPGFIGRWWWALVFLALVVIAALVYWARASKAGRDRIRVHGLVANLAGTDGELIGSEVRAPGGYVNSFNVRFVPPDEGGPRLEPAQGIEVARSRREGRVVVATADGDRGEIELGAPIPLDDEHSLVITDSRLRASVAVGATSPPTSGIDMEAPTATEDEDLA